MSGVPQTIVDYLNTLAFRGNTNLRPKGSAIQYTEEMIDEYEKCKNDPVYFISNYIKVVHPDKGIVLMELYEYQERMVRAYHDHRRVIFLTARQQGKCLSINSSIKIRNKTTKELVEITLGELYEWQWFKQEISKISREDLQELCETFYRTSQSKTV